ncbi:MAG: hypothetical protein ACXV8S_06325 [Methylobacter sp.]
MKVLLQLGKTGLDCRKPGHADMYGVRAVRHGLKPAGTFSCCSGLGNRCGAPAEFN